MILWFFIACKGKDSANDDSAPPIHYIPDCADAVPVISNFTVVDGGMVEQKDGDTWPSILFHVDANDTDGDLEVYRWEVAYDTVVDNAVNGDSFNTYVKNGETTGVDDCTTFDRSVDFTIAISGTPLSSGMLTEWQAVFVDSHDLRSAPLIASITLP